MSALGTTSTLRLAAAVVGIEGAAIAVGGAVWAVRSLTGHPDNPAASIVGALFAIGLGALIGRLAMAIAAGKVWARSPVVAVETLLLPVGFALTFQGGQKLYGVPVLACAIAALLLLFSAPVREVFDRDR